MDWKQYISDQRLEAHDQWRKTRTGEGRIALEGLDFRNANLVDAPFEGMRFVRCDFSGADLSRTMIGELEDCVFDGAKMQECNIQGDWDHPVALCRFRGANLTDAEIGGFVVDCDFTQALLVRANLYKASVRASSFMDADLHEARRVRGLQFSARKSAWEPSRLDELHPL